MPESQKKLFLEKEGILNTRAERVNHPLFEDLEFFDPFDLPQVRYEMLRAAKVDNIPVAKACRQFGFSREYFYQLNRAFNEQGYYSLLGSALGRRPILAVNQEIVNFIMHRKFEDPKYSSEDLRKDIVGIYRVTCSRRTVERIIEKLDLQKKIQLP
jgi:hypothetical protein